MAGNPKSALADAAARWPEDDTGGEEADMTVALALGGTPPYAGTHTEW